MAGKAYKAQEKREPKAADKAKGGEGKSDMAKEMAAMRGKMAMKPPMSKSKK